MGKTPIEPFYIEFCTLHAYRMRTVNYDAAGDTCTFPNLKESIIGSIRL